MNYFAQRRLQVISVIIRPRLCSLVVRAYRYSCVFWCLEMIDVAPLVARGLSGAAGRGVWLGRAADRGRCGDDTGSGDTERETPAELDTFRVCECECECECVAGGVIRSVMHGFVETTIGTATRRFVAVWTPCSMRGTLCVCALTSLLVAGLGWSIGGEAGCVWRDAW